MKKIVVTDFITHLSEAEQICLKDSYDVTFANGRSEDDILPYIEDADALVVWHELSITKKSFEVMKECSIIVRMGVGFDNVDLDSSRMRGVIVCNVPDYGTDVVADHAMALLLAMNRNLSLYNEKFREDELNWDPFLPGSAKRLRGKKLGIIGMGRIGMATALRAKAFGLEIQFYDPYVKAGIDKVIGAQQTDLQYLAKNSDFISIHTPLTEETKHMFSTELFNIVKKECILINTARGEVVSLDALYGALKSGRLAGAAMDVLEFEPLPAAHPLALAWRAKEDWVAHKLVITPHAGFFTDESYNELKLKGWKTIKKYFEQGIIANCVL